MSHLCHTKWGRFSSRTLQSMMETVIVFLVFFAAPCVGQQFENHKLLAPDGGDGDQFGSSLSISGSRALAGTADEDILGQNSGAARIFGYDSASGTWLKEAKLIASDSSNGDYFGYSVSILGDKAIVGAPFDDDYGPDSGSAYVFSYDSVSGTWYEEAKLIASDGEALDEFGRSVSISGTCALVGAYRGNGIVSDSGAAYLFRYDSVSGTWQEEAILFASDGADSDRFGASVALYDDWALVGAVSDDDYGVSSGSAYIFAYDSVSGTWREEAKLLASDGAAWDYFGESVAIHGDKALIGSSGSGNDSGSAYLFCYDSVSGTWQEETKLTASDGSGGDAFGGSVAIHGTRALGGAYLAHNQGDRTGSAYLFVYDSPSGTWQEEAKLLASDREQHDHFGTAVALSADRAIIGAEWEDTTDDDAGAAYAYDFNSVLAIDVKCNGEDQNVIVNSGENATVTIDIKNGYHPGLEGDLWVAAVLPFSGWGVWTCGPFSNPHWMPGTGNVYYTGPPLNHAATVFDHTVPPGNYKVYLAVDMIPDGVINLAALWDFDVVDFMVQ